MLKKSLAVQLAAKNQPEITKGIDFVYEPDFEKGAEIYSFIYSGKINCNKGFVIKGHFNHPHENELIDPIYISDFGNNPVLLFDHTQHGYNGVFGLTVTDEIKQGPCKQFNCPRCKNKYFQLQLTLIYEIWDDEILEDCEVKEKIQNIFTCFVLDGLCTECNWKGNISTVECA